MKSFLTKNILVYIAVCHSHPGAAQQKLAGRTYYRRRRNMQALAYK
jgi:hypothetical protein